MGLAERQFFDRYEPMALHALEKGDEQHIGPIEWKDTMHVLHNYKHNNVPLGPL